MKRSLLSAVCLLSLSASAETLTLQQALTRALQVNNTIERARAEITATDESRKQLLSAVMPRITLSGAGIRNSEEVAFGSGNDARTVLPRNDWNYRVVLSQPLYAGRREFRAYAQAQLGVANAREAERGTEDAVLLRVASSFQAIADADARITVEKKNMEIAESRRKQAQAFYEAGETTKVDVLRADTAIKAAQRLLAIAQQARQTAVSVLRQDLDLDGDIEVAAPEHPLPPLPAAEDLEHRAEESRADVAAAKNVVTIADLEVKKQRGFWLPTLTFDGGWVNQKSAFPASRYSYGAIRFNVPLLQSGEVEARIAQAKAKQKEAQLALEDAQRGAREDVRKALIDLHTAETALGLAKEQLAAAEAEYQQSFELYRAQESTSLDVAASETSLADARRAVAEETLNRDLSELRVWYAAGQLKNALGTGETK